MNRNEIIRLVYILGSGRCGSTLLDRLLNNYECIFGSGEILNLSKSQETIENDTESGRFWRSILNEYQTNTGLSLDFIKNDLRRAIKSFLWLSRRMQRYIIGAYYMYISMIWQHARKVQDIKYMTDTTKRIDALFVISKCVKEIRILILVRDFRGIIYSYQKRYGRIKGFWLGIVRIYQAYAFGLLFCRVARKKYLIVKYEKVVADTSAELSRISQFLELDMAKQDFQRGHRIYFGLGGNPMKRDENLIISHDTGFVRDQNQILRLIISMFMFPLNISYGYSLF